MALHQGHRDRGRARALTKPWPFRISSPAVIRFSSTQTQEFSLEWADRSIELVTAETRIRVGSRRRGFEASYRRPVVVQAGDEVRSRLRIIDHVLVARVFAVVLTGLATAGRLRQ